jgi:predicted small secreted protein
MNNKGQSIFSEYVMIFFVVIAAGVAMTAFVQRSFEARIHDARNLLIQTVNSACDANCMNATGGNIAYEYEPYYQQYTATVQNYQKDSSGTTQGNSQVLGAIYIRTVNGEASTSSVSYQLPPACSGPNPPAYCANGGQP